MVAGRALPELTLTAEENNRLLEWARRRTTAQALALRARIVLACAQGTTNRQVAQRCRVTVQTVGKWRRRLCRAAAATDCSMPRALASRARSPTRRWRR